MALPLPDNTSKTHTGNTFLGTRPGTITKQNSRNKAEKDARAARSRRAAVNYELNRRAENARNQYMQLPINANSRVVQSITTPAFNIGQYGRTGTLANTALRRLLPKANDYTALAKFNAQRDTALDAISQQYFAAHGLDQTTHNYFIQQGNKWMTDDKALTDWILSDPETAPDKQGEYEEYMRKYLRTVNTFDPSDNRYAQEQQFTEDAPLPPWIPATAMNIRMWDYYKTYAHDVVQTMADRYVENREQQRDFAKNPYKSAFSAQRNEDDIDSFFDLVIAPGDERSVVNNFKNYFTDYYINPIKNGKFLTVAGNAVWNLMDTMDFAARGVRAFVAGDTILGGARGSFKGQQEYWATIPGYDENQSRLLQEKFMANGGQDLLNLDHPEFSVRTTKSREELIKELDEAFGGRQYWDSIYQTLTNLDFFEDRGVKDLKQGVENVKQAYTDPSASFEADTDSTAANILIESALDPGLVLGGISKNLANNSIRGAAELAVRDGLTMLMENSDDAAMLLKDKRVRRAISEFIRSNDGRNIIFKDSKKFGEDVNVFMRRLENDIPHLFANKAEKKAFGDIISAHLFSKNQNINTKIIESTGWARNAIDNKTFKAAYVMDRAIDSIDSAIIKSSFAAPWALVKGISNGKRILLNNSSVGRYYYAKRLRQAEAARTVRDSITGAVDVTSYPDLVAKYNAGQLDEDSFKAGLREIVKAYDDTSKAVPGVIRQFSEGKITAEDALKYVNDRINNMSGGKYHNVDDLIAQVDSYDVRYAGDLSAAYDRLKRSVDLLQDSIYRRSDAAVADFLTEVGHANNIDDIRRLFRDNMDNEVIMNLRTQVSDKAPFNISVEEIDNIVSDLKSGLFSDVPVSEENLKTAVRQIEHASTDTVNRVVNVRDIKKLIQHEYEYLLNSSDAYVKKLAPIFDVKPGGARQISVDYAVQCIESAKRSLVTSEYLKAKSINQLTALSVHNDPRMADLRRLKDTIRGLDIVSLKDTEVITVMHVDKMAMFRKFSENPAIAKMYGNDFDNIIAPALDVLNVKGLDNIDLTSDTFVQDMLRLQELKYGHDRTEVLISELKTLHTLSDKKLHTVLNGLANNFGRPQGTLMDTLASPNILHRNLETTLRTQFGTPKLGNAGMTELLKSVNTSNPSSFLEPYLKEFEDPIVGPKIKAKFDKIANVSNLDPTGYVKKQMLTSLIIDPTLVDKYNALAKKGNTPIFFHINTTGLNTEINEITSISCIKWSPIEVSDTSPLTLEKILDAIPDDPILFKQGMSDTQIDGISENVLRRMDMKGLSSSQLRGSIRDLYRAADKMSQKSEQEVIEEFCEFLQQETIIHAGKMGPDSISVPTLVVHDLDGFNVLYFNKRAAEAYNNASRTSSTRSYIETLSQRIQDASDNTYTRLAGITDDSSFSSDELAQIEKMLHTYADDINQFAGDNFDPFDFEEFGRAFERVLYESTNPVDDELSSVRKSIVNASTGSAVDIEKYKHAMQDITEFARYPKQFAFISNKSDENAVSIALKAVGKDSVNVDSRVYVEDVLSFFDIADETGKLQSNIPALQRMHNLAQYVIRNRDRTIASTANDFLAPHKEQFDKVIDIVRQIGGHYSRGSEYGFLAHIKTPNTPAESYLLCQKLYDDYIKYWCFNDTSKSFFDDAENLNELKQELDKFYNETYTAAGDLYTTTKELTGERWGLFKSNYAEYKSSAKEDFLDISRARWTEYREEKSATKAAYVELNDELWDAFAKQSDLAEDLLDTAKQTTKELWEEYRVDKEYAQYLKQDAQERSSRLWDDYRARKAELDEYYKQLKAETDRVVNSWKSSKEYRNPPRTVEKLRTRTQKLVKASVKDVLKDTSLKRNEVSEIVKQYDDLAKRVVSLFIDNKTSEAGELIVNSVSDTVKKLTRVDDTAYRESEAFRNYLRSSAIDPSDTIKKDITDFNSFRKRNFGSIKFRKGGTDYDKFLLELEELFPEYLDGESFEGPSGLFTHLEEKLSSLKPKTVAISDDEQAYLIDKLSNDIFDALQEEAEVLKVKQLSFDDIMYKPLDTTGLEYFKNYKEYRAAFDRIDWKGYKKAKESLAVYRKHLFNLQEGIYDEYLAQINLMKSKYDLAAMSAKTEEVWSAFNEAAYTKWLQKHWTREQSIELREMFNASIDALYHEAKADTEDFYKAYVNSLEVYRETEYGKAVLDTELLWEMYKHDKKALWEAYKNDPDRLAVLQQFFDGLMDYFNNYRARVFDEFSSNNFGLGFSRLNTGEFDDIFKILDGEKRPEIFKNVAKSDYFSKIYSYRDGVMREGIDMATKLSEANSDIASNLRQLDFIDSYYRNAGIVTQTDRLLGMLHMKAKTLFDMLDATDISRRQSFQTFIREASEMFHLRVQQSALDNLRVNGKFDRNALISELLYNNFNHICFNSHAYTTDEMRELTDFVNGLIRDGDDFLSVVEDRSSGNIYIALNYNAEISTDGTKRFLNRVESFDRPVHAAVSFVDFDELKAMLDLDDIEEFRDIYRHLVSCWEDTRVLSNGLINGTSGRTVSRRQAEEYLESLPLELGNMLSPKGLLMSETARGVVYDPGFVINDDSDILLDFLGTLSQQANIAKEDAVLVNEVFGPGSGIRFNDLARNFSDDELIRYFGNSSDYVVVTLTENSGTRTGLQVTQLKLDNKAALQVAKTSPNIAILPYDMYYEIADTMNRTQNDGVYRRLLSKYLWVYKAFALGAKPGTWIRNYIDATTKAALDGGEDPLTGIASLVSYHGKATRDIAMYYKIVKTDPSLLTEANWGMVQKVFNTDMPYEDFEMLKGIVDSHRFTSADKYFTSKTADRRAGLDVISGDNIGIRNLEEEDISKAFDKYLASEINLPFKKNEFLDIYFNRVNITTEQADLYEDMMRRLSRNLRNSDATNIFDKTINNMFKPFAYSEYITRYAQSLYLRDMGLSGNQTLRHIHQTQFYNAPTWGVFNKLETIMPFITFKYNNIMYWIRMMDENPRYFRYFEEVYGNIADDTIENMLEQSSEFDYESDNAAQTGGIPTGVNNVYFNVGNSFLSAMNDFYGFTNNFRQLNPLLRETLRYSAYAFGLNSKQFLSALDLDVSDESPERNMLKMIPGYTVINQASRTFKNIANTCTENGGPTVDVLWSTLSFLGALGVRKSYSNAIGFSFAEWQADLEAQGKWYDLNTGKIMDISMKNDYGVNNPNNSFEDVEAYIMLHFGKVWDPNQTKFVFPEQVVAGNFDLDFDFENDPDAWAKLQAWMRYRYGKVYDYNLKKFVLESELSPGGLNDSDISWDKKCQLMDEKFGLKWDANQNAFVTPDRFIAGGLNQTFDMKNDRSAWNNLQSLRYALYGETYNKAIKKFEKTGDPQVVILSNAKEQKAYDNYFSRLGIPRLEFTDEKLRLNSEGFLVTENGKYVLTNNADYNQRLFSKFINVQGSVGRSYSNFKQYSYSRLRKSNKVYHGRTLSDHYYTGYGWNDREGYYRFQFEYNYQYHSPQPGRKLHRLLSPKIVYPYGGGYNKFSYYTR